MNLTELLEAYNKAEMPEDAKGAIQGILRVIDKHKDTLSSEALTLVDKLAALIGHGEKEAEAFSEERLEEAIEACEDFILSDVDENDEIEGLKDEVGDNLMSLLEDMYEEEDEEEEDEEEEDAELELHIPHPDESLDARSQRIRDAWYAKQGTEMATGPVSYLKDVFEMHVIFSTKDGLLKIPYTENKQGQIEFGEPAKVKVEYTTLEQGLEETRYVGTFSLEENTMPEKIIVHTLGKWQDPRYGEFSMTREKMDEMVKNFKAKTVHPNSPIDAQVPIDCKHETAKGSGAAGWLTGLKRVGDNLVATVKWTEDGKSLVAGGSFKYISPKYTENYTTALVDDKKKYGATLLEVALTNNPLLVELGPFTQPILLSKDAVVSMNAERVILPVATKTKKGGERVVEENKKEEESVEVVKVLRLEDEDGDVIELTSAKALELFRTVETLKKTAHETTVALEVVNAEKRGVAPAAVKLIKTIMLQCSPETRATIELEKGEEPLNLYQSMSKLLKEIPAVDMGEHTKVKEEKPASENKETPMSLEEAEEYGRKRFKELSGLNEPDAVPEI